MSTLSFLILYSFGNDRFFLVECLISNVDIPYTDVPEKQGPNEKVVQEPKVLGDTEF